MPTIAALPKAWNDPDGVALTFVVPAPNGCDLRCRGCFVAQRGEARLDAGLTASDYRSFILAVARREPVALVSVQGYEPLLPASWPVTRAVLEAGAMVGAKTAIVTNGTRLVEHEAELAALGVEGLTISLDGADEVTNDRWRGVAGAFQATVAGIEAAMASSALSEATMVASLLRPGGAHDLEKMPALLASMNVQTWVVTPLLCVGTQTIGTPVDSRERIIADLLSLQQIAERHNIVMLADDEFDHALRHLPDDSGEAAQLRVRRLQRPDGVFRLSPDGSLSVGEEILRRVGRGYRRWAPHDDPYPLILSARAAAAKLG